MKNRIIIFCFLLITLSLTAFGITNWENLKTKTTEKKEIAPSTTCNKKEKPTATMVGPKIYTFPDFIYDIGSLFEPYTIAKIKNATTIKDFINEEDFNEIVTLKFVEIILINNQTKVKEIGYSTKLTKPQLKLLQSLEYSANVKINVAYTKINKETGILEDALVSPHLTIVPENQATYSEGKDKLKKFLKEKSKNARIEANVEPRNLQPAKLFFTVTKTGNIEKVSLDRTSNYPLLDKTMKELIQNLPGTWKPAENSKGEKIDQELVVSFGLIGC